MNLLRFSVMILMVAMTMACTRPAVVSNEHRILWVNSYKVPCTGVGPMHCLQIQVTEYQSDGWQNLYEGIEGFDYAPGFIYRLEVEEIRFASDQVPADASNVRYRLVSVLDKKPDLTLRIHDIWVLEAIEGVSIRKTGLFDAKERPYLEIFVARKEMLGNDGCSGIRGDIAELDETNLRLEGISADREDCSADGYGRFRQLLAEVRTYTIEERKLYLFDRADQEILRFKKSD